MLYILPTRGSPFPQAGYRCQMHNNIVENTCVYFKTMLSISQSGHALHVVLYSVNIFTPKIYAWPIMSEIYAEWNACAGGAWADPSCQKYMPNFSADRKAAAYKSRLVRNVYSIKYYP